MLTRYGTGSPYTILISSSLIHNPGSSCMSTVIANKYLWRKNCNLQCSRVAFADSYSISINKDRLSYDPFYSYLLLWEKLSALLQNIYGHEIHEVTY